MGIILQIVGIILLGVSLFFSISSLKQGTSASTGVILLIIAGALIRLGRKL